MRRPNRLFQTFFIKFLPVLILFLALREPLSNAQAQKTWQWVQQLGGPSWDISAGITCVFKSDIHVTGSYFNTLQGSNRKITSKGNQDVFIAGFDEDGNLQNLYSAGGKGNDLATCISSTRDNNIIIGGSINDTAIFGKIKVAAGSKRLFVAKMDSRGVFTWVTAFDVAGEASLYLSGLDQNNDVFVSGVFSGTLAAGKLNATAKGKKDIFLARMNPDGVVEKLISLGSEADDVPGSLDVENSGNIILSGTFGKDFENGGKKFSVEGKNNVFVAKFNESFKADWINILSSDSYCLVSSARFDNAGNVFAAGSFASRLQVNNTILKSKGYTDGFVIKYGKNGVMDWVKSFGTWYYDYATHVNLDRVGGAIISGTIGDTLTIDSLNIRPVSGQNSALVLQFSPKGKVTWGDCISGKGRIFSSGSVLDKSGNLYYTGSFNDKFEKDRNMLTSRGDQDIFIAKYYNCALTKADILGKRNFCPGTGTELSVKKSFINPVWNDTIQGKYQISVVRPGSYWVKMVDKEGCPVADTIEVVENKLPVFSLGNDTTILAKDSLILKAPDNYMIAKWHDYSFEKEFIAKARGNGQGTENYWLTVRDSLSCSFTDTISVTYLAVNKPDKKIRISAFPNPAIDKFTWYMETPGPENFIMELTDEKGYCLSRQKIEHHLPGERKDIYIGNYLSGAYNLRITDFEGNLVSTLRIIKR